MNNIEDQWRQLADQKKYLEAAEVLIAYIESDPDTTKPSPSLETTCFHIGQMYASAGDEHYQEAISWFRKSHKPGRDDWNMYVDGTINFLEHDHEGLVNKIARLQGMNGHEDYMTVLEHLSEGLEKGLSYDNAYLN